MRRLNHKNIKAVRNRPGFYRLYDEDGHKIYDGSSKRLENRLHACHYGRADYDQLPHKRRLRREAKFFDVEYMDTESARAKDRKIKSRFGRY